MVFLQVIKLNEKYLKDFISADDKQKLDSVWKEAEAALNKVKDRTGAGKDMLGWVDLPGNYAKKPELINELDRIKAAAEKIRKNSEVVIVAGIGGSYLGSRAAIEFIKSHLYNNTEKDTPDIYFLGNSISTDNLNEIIKICEKKNFSVIVISKSGTTTEPAIVFRILRGLLEKKYNSEEVKERIFAITDKNGEKSKLKALADLKGYEKFVVPDDIGGRYSVLTAVGLLPIAVAGIDIDEIIEGAAFAEKTYLEFSKNNDCLKYAVLRNLLYQKGKSVEIMAAYEPALAMMNEWWKQLFGESEGKNKLGIYTSSVIFTTDLHSLGQFIQDGSRIMFETVINIENSQSDFVIPADSEKIDGMDYVDGMTLHEVNYKAMLGTVIAHTDGGTPNIILNINKRDEKTFGELVYFFELACAVSGYMLGVNPFDQPGVEDYKTNMFALLGRPADKDKNYPEIRKEIEKRI
ncbi:MAG: glucose-6-phosphate isomerase [Oscillospiraceae bacterium]|nr:glucose-6-phosphate isomerase [Oscillospiraceae bacterium]